MNRGAGELGGGRDGEGGINDNNEDDDDAHEGVTPIDEPTAEELAAIEPAFQAVRAHVRQRFGELVAEQPREWLLAKIAVLRSSSPRVVVPDDLGAMPIEELRRLCVELHMAATDR